MGRTILLVLHICGVAGWLGANFVQLSIGHRFARGDVAAARTWNAATRWMAERYYNVAGVLIGVTGVGLVMHGDWPWSSGFIWVGAVVVAVGGILGAAEFVPSTRRLDAALDAGDTVRIAAVTRRQVRFALLDTSLVVLTVVAMVHKIGT